MKSEYTTPRISVEALEKTDVLLSSPAITPSDDPLTTQKFKKENQYRQYRDFMSFALNPDNWLD